MTNRSIARSSSSEVEMHHSALAVTTNQMRVKDSHQSEPAGTDNKSDLTRKKVKVFPSQQLGREN